MTEEVNTLLHNYSFLDTFEILRLFGALFLYKKTFIIVEPHHEVRYVEAKYILGRKSSADEPQGEKKPKQDQIIRMLALSVIKS